ncbi:MAG TPA: glycosyltransferase family 4 protein [Mycobacteriales bacterium]|jgi:glycosyltransferase involved in cell wall biosynthesis|nr:glycosyltransferase family 4 protein [Mycobacteriales bacterium]
MRIVITTPYCWPEVRRGGERLAHQQAAALAAAGHDVTIWSTSPGAPDRDSVLGVETHRMRRHGRGGRWFGQQAVEVNFGVQSLARLALRRMDVWHAIGVPDAAAAAALSRVRRGVRSVYTDLGYPAKASRDRRRDRRFQDFVVRNIDVYVCLSNSTADYLRRDYGRDGVVVNPGVDLEAYRPGSRDPRPTIVFSSQVDEPRKNLELLLEALDLILTDVPDVQLWLLGQGDASRALATATAAARGAVTVCEAVDETELRARYAAAWVLCLPSVAEAFGLVVVEALASGTPAVVRADSGGPADIVSSPRVGAVVGPTAADLADGLRTGLRLAREASTTTACRAVAASYDWRDAVVPRLEEVYAR